MYTARSYDSPPGWKQTPTLHNRLPSASAGDLGSFRQSGLQPAVVLPSDTLLPVCTSHAGSSQSRRRDFARSHLLGMSPAFHPPCETKRRFFFLVFFYILNFHSASQPLHNGPTWLQSGYSCVSSQSKLLPDVIYTTTLPFLLAVSVMPAGRRLAAAPGFSTRLSGLSIPPSSPLYQHAFLLPPFKQSEN